MIWNIMYVIISKCLEESSLVQSTEFVAIHSFICSQHLTDSQTPVFQYERFVFLLWNELCAQLIFCSYLKYDYMISRFAISFIYFAFDLRIKTNESLDARM